MGRLSILILYLYVIACFLWDFLLVNIPCMDAICNLVIIANRNNDPYVSVGNPSNCNGFLYEKGRFLQFFFVRCLLSSGFAVFVGRDFVSSGFFENTPLAQFTTLKKFVAWKTQKAKPRVGTTSNLHDAAHWRWQFVCFSPSVLR